MPDEYLMQEQFCERFHISDRTAERWRATGEGPPFVRLGQRKIAYRASDCERWAAARTFRHRAEELQSVARGGASDALSRLRGFVVGKAAFAIFCAS
jgi:predicted DNA-binding transcriptional regulator AlpA